MVVHLERSALTADETETKFFTFGSREEPLVLRTARAVVDAPEEYNA